MLAKGFVENMKDYIASSTICLTKPGGLTSTEIAILNRPMIHIMPIPGVENYNAKFFSENGLSLVANTMEEVIENTRSLLQDKKKQVEMINNQKKIINKNSAACLVEFVKNINERIRNMKKIIWVFGESATGKKTLIEYLMNKPESELAIDLGLGNVKIDVVKQTITSNVASFDDKKNEQNRHIQITEKIKEFANTEEYSVLLIKGQTNDMDEKYGNTLRTSALLHPELEREILLLEASNLDALYERIVNKDWFQADKEKYSEMFPREWLDKSVMKHREKVYSYETLGYEITEIDTTNGYKINKKEENYGQSSHFGR